MESQWNNCPTQMCMENCHWNGGGGNYVSVYVWCVAGWWRWALLSQDGVATSQMVGVFACVNLPLHHKVQKFSSGTGSPGSSRKKGRKTVVVWYVWCVDWLSRDCWRSHSTASFYVRLWAEDGATRQALAISTLCCWTVRDDCFQGSFGILFWAFCQDFMQEMVS